MNQIQCPHCRHSLVDDGQLAGQVVACPQCQRQFQMPGHAKPPVIVTGPQVSTSSATYRSSGRRPGRRKDPTALIVLSLAGLAVLIGGVGFVLLQQTESKPDVSSSSDQSRITPAVQPGSNDSEQKAAEAAKLAAELERRQREDEARLEEEQRIAESNAKLRIDEEVRRQLEERRIDRESRLAALAERERREIAPIETEIHEIQSKIATGDRNMARLRQQMQSLPQSSGIPGGTRFSPSIPREVRDIERQGIQNWQEIEAGFAKLRAELVGKLRVAEQKLQQKQSELERERQAILADL